MREKKSDTEAAEAILELLTTEGQWLRAMHVAQRTHMTEARVRRLVSIMIDKIVVRDAATGRWMATKETAKKVKLDPEKNNLRDARVKAQAERKAKLLAEIERRNEWTGRMALQAACRISDRSGLDLLGDLVREGKIAKKIALNEKCVHVTVYIATAKADTPYEPEPVAAGERIRQRVKTEVLTPDEVAKPVKWKPSVNESGSARFVRLAMERTLAGEELTESELTEAAHNAGIMIGTGTATEAVKAFKRRAEAELARRKRERLGYAPMEARA